MRRTAISLLILLLLCAVIAPSEGSAQEERGLIGRWSLVSEKGCGRMIETFPDVHDVEVEFRANGRCVMFVKRKTAEEFGIVFSIPITIDASKNHLCRRCGRIHPGPALGVYELDGDNLTISFGECGRARPKSVDAEPEGTEYWIVKLKRIR